ncbi:HD-GYP domain-containing protein [Geoalkalibacter halelectricus]|uniref:HD domain-containing protein n=1 Tax=Geoalkalibacter halelectricus TaxID=2847045 RepID=A0ABY5ZQI1_9BACT|nr:HD domain-containing phosphohydrolase [Geoalkalibacter halelectricus]UWZ81388.1 HD domain-containing protein [Geoalkalibacter halelectricus]
MMPPRASPLAARKSIPYKMLTHLQVDTEAEKDYRPIDLGCLHPEISAPCDLFLQVGPRRYTLFARKGLGFSQNHRQNLMETGVQELYIQEEDAPVFYRYLKDALCQVVRNPNCPSETKAQFVHAACRDIMTKVYSDPRASFIEQALEVIRPSVDLVVRDDRATRCMVQMTAHDVNTYTHCTNVGIFSIALARIFFGSSSEHDLQNMAAGFFLHDLGKCKIPLEVLNKPGPLDADEWQTVKKHPRDGFEILAETGQMTDEARIIILQHHEKDDGSGYPNQIRAKDIHPYARICRIADVYEALTSDRPYHTRHSTYETLKMMKEKILADVDQDLFGHFIKLFRV